MATVNTDKEIYLILTRCPEFIAELSGLPAHHKSEVKSVNLKAINRTADGVEFPNDKKAPIRVFEVQFQHRKKKGNVYRRLLASMILIQEEHRDRDVEGVIFFADKSSDPKTSPWHGNDLVLTVYLDNELKKLKKQDPDHPLVAIFSPVFETDTETVVAEARENYNRITTNSNLNQTQRRVLSEVFEHWLLERLPNHTRKQIAMILDLPDVRHTVCGKELLEEGREEGAADVLLTLLRSRFKVPNTVETRIRNLKKSQLDELALALFDLEKLGDLKNWLSEMEK